MRGRNTFHLRSAHGVEGVTGPVDQELVERPGADGSPVGKDQASGHQALNRTVARAQPDAQYFGHGLIPVLGPQHQVECHRKVERAK
jgi:hypothetical protein